MTEKIIVTHASPDLDAIGYAWLMKRYAPGFQDAKIVLMPLNNLDEALLESADSVGDMGAVYDPEYWRFDHHQLPGEQSTSTCATSMIFEWLYYHEGLKVGCLKPLIEVILRGDQGITDPIGLHTILWGAATQKNPITGQKLSDQEIMATGFDLLDRVAAWLLHKAEATEGLESKVIWKSDDGFIWAIKGGDTRTSFAAYEQGAKVVVYEGGPQSLDGGIITYPVGVSRAPNYKEVHLGEVVERVIQKSSVYNTLTLIGKEISSWYQHQDGFFCGRGGTKAPCPDPLKVDLVEIAKEIDSPWSWRH